MKHALAAGLLWATTLAFAALASSPAASATLLEGLDHIPVAVNDLDQAAARYRSLGFTLKPGRYHSNGIRNQHVKFADGTELELISAATANDALSSQYVAHLQAGDGPAFLGIRAPDMDSLAARLATLRQPGEREGGLLVLPAPLSYIFFARRGHSPTDLPEHFAHANTASSLLGVWLAVEDASSEEQLLESLGATVVEEMVFAPTLTRAKLVRVGRGEVLLLPAAQRLVADRAIVGATLLTRDLQAVRDQLATANLRAPDMIETGDRRSILLAPRVTHGLWLEFRARP